MADGEGDATLLRNITNVRREIFRLYGTAKRGRMDKTDAYKLAQILHLGAKLMVETEPQVELRRLQTEHEKLRQMVAELEGQLAKQVPQVVPWTSTNHLDAAKLN
jgi:hypothetical protein